METTLKNKKIDSINIKQLAIGCTLLLLGVLIYMLDRNSEQVFFIYAFKLPYFHHPEYRKMFGEVSMSLPSFLHGCSFSLLTCAFLPLQNKRNCFIVCLIWAIIDILFEFGQLIKPFTSTDIPPFLSNNKVFMVTINYFRYGTFDYMDILFAILGCVCAYFIIIINYKGGNHETSSISIK